MEPEETSRSKEESAWPTVLQALALLAVVGLAAFMMLKPPARAPHRPLPSAAGPGGRPVEYVVDEECNSSSTIRVARISFRDDATVVTMAVHKPTGGGVRAWPPGHPQAFRLERAGRPRPFRLLRAEDIAIAPAWSTIDSGGSLTFRLTFERVEPAEGLFHVLEGEGGFLLEGSWIRCRDLRLVGAGAR